MSSSSSSRPSAETEAGTRIDAPPETVIYAPETTSTSDHDHGIEIGGQFTIVPPRDDSEHDSASAFEFECPTCYKSFDNTKSMKLHHSRSHGARLTEYRVCKHCTQLYEPTRRDQTYCSNKCQGLHNRKRVSIECPECETMFECPECEADRRRYCSRDCQKAHSRIEKHCETCGDEFVVSRYRKDTARYCSEQCRGIERTDLCPICYRSHTGETENGVYCSDKCVDIAERLESPYFCRPITYDALLEHVYLSEGHLLEATHRIIAEELPDEEHTLEEIRADTAEYFSEERKNRRFIRRLNAIRPEDLGLSPLGERV